MQEERRFGQKSVWLDWRIACTMHDGIYTPISVAETVVSGDQKRTFSLEAPAWEWEMNYRLPCLGAVTNPR